MAGGEKVAVQSQAVLVLTRLDFVNFMKEIQ